LIARRFNRDDPGDDRGAGRPSGGAPDDAGEFALEKTHERRILSWSPDPDEELGDPEVEEEVEPPAAVQEAPQPARIAPEPVRQTPPPVQARPVEPPPAVALPQEPAAPVAEAPLPAERTEVPAQAAPAGQEQRRRGRPRGRPRRQVHFHVDPDEELLLLEAAKKHGSQQKGLVAALQALQDNEVLRVEIERLRTECERQRMLLADAEAIFNR
jgi:hypothetical protein